MAARMIDGIESTNTLPMLSTDHPVRFSRLKMIAQSPAHYYRALSWQFVETESTRCGSATHAMVLGGADVAVFDGRRVGDEWKKFCADNIGNIILNRREYDKACRMAESVTLSSAAMEILDAAPIRESLIRWRYLDRDFTSTPDARGEVLIDLKTTRIGSLEGFGREMLRRAYHAQLSCYGEAMIATGEKAPAENYIIAVENVEPYLTTVRRVTPRAIENGRRLWTGWFETLRACEAINRWPGYSEAIVDLDIEETATVEIDGEEFEL